MNNNPSKLIVTWKCVEDATAKDDVEKAFEMLLGLTPQAQNDEEISTTPV